VYPFRQALWSNAQTNQVLPTPVGPVMRILRCSFAYWQLNGIFAGGLSPGNENDDAPVEYSLDIDGTYGDTCYFDVD
jgi:hypothetical protein